MWVRAITVFFFIIVLESVHGVVREYFIVPAIGDASARQIGFLVGSVIVLFGAWLMSPWLNARTRGAQLQVGALWVALLLSFEFGLGYARGFSWERISLEFDPRKGGLMAVGVVVMLLAPIFGAALRGTDK